MFVFLAFSRDVMTQCQFPSVKTGLNNNTEQVGFMVDHMVLLLQVHSLAFPFFAKYLSIFPV
jgi:hypothetical protein